MPKIPHTIRRNGVYYFNFRYPQRLIKAGLVEKDLERESLGTKDWREAKPRAARRAALIQSEVERLLKQLGRDEQSGRPKTKQGERIDFTSLSKARQRDLVLQWFLEMEREADRLREHFQTSQDDRWKWDVLDTQRGDLSDYEGAEGSFPLDWERNFSEFLEEQRISVAPDSFSEELVRLYRRAVIESQWRTVESLEGRLFQKRDPLFEAIHANSELESKRDNGHTIREICDRFPNRKQEGRLSKATLMSYTLPIRILSEFCGPTMSLSSLQFEDGERLIEFLATIPVNASKRYPGKTLRQAAKKENGSSEPTYLSPKRQKDVFLVIKSIFNYAVEIGWLEQNPFGSRALLDRLPKVTARTREQFTPDELKGLFSSPIFLQWRGKRDSKEQPAEGRYWIPLLGALLGLRANEAASLLVEDVKEEGGSSFLWIREVNDAGVVRKRLKTRASERRVPIHRELHRLGFLDYVDIRRKKDPEGFLFPEMTPNKHTDNRAKAFSQWFGRLTKSELGDAAKVHGKDFHSFRHSVTDCLRGLTESDEKRYAILGWSEAGGKKNAGYDYGGGFSMKDLQKLVDQIEIPGIEVGDLES